MRDLGLFKNEIRDATWESFAGRLSVNKQKKTKKNKEEKEFDVLMLTLWYYLELCLTSRDVLDESLFLYVTFKINQYLRNWGNYLKLRSIEGICFLLFFLMKFHATLHCAAMFFCANLALDCIECFVYALANFVFLYVFMSVHNLTFPVGHTFSSVVIS